MSSKSKLKRQLKKLRGDHEELRTEFYLLEIRVKALQAPAPYAPSSPIPATPSVPYFGPTWLQQHTWSSTTDTQQGTLFNEDTPPEESPYANTKGGYVHIPEPAPEGFLNPDLSGFTVPDALSSVSLRVPRHLQTYEE